MSKKGRSTVEQNYCTRVIRRLTPELLVVTSTAMVHKYFIYSKKYGQMKMRLGTGTQEIVK